MLLGFWMGQLRLVLKEMRGKLALHPREATWMYSVHAVQKKKNVEGQASDREKGCWIFKEF
jgi:hypothetical protein